MMIIKKGHNSPRWLLTATILIIIFGYFVSRNNDRKAVVKVNNLMETGEFAIGKITGHTYSSSSSGRGLLSTIMYNYTVEEKEYICYLSHAVNEAITGRKFLSSTHKGDLFLVVYEYSNPQNSILHLDSPIQDSTDFNSHIRFFSERRKIINVSD